MTAVPVSVLTGFLGAGKTTLLNQLLRDPSLARTAVIVNEFGAVGLDHALIEASGEDVIELSDGCLCCTVRGDLVDTLERLLDGSRPIDRLIIETTGLADPAPVLRAIMAHPTRAARMRLDGVVAVVDALNGPATLERHAEARRQVAMADRVVVSKRELAGDEGTDAAIEGAIRAHNRTAPLLHARTVAPADLLDAGLVDGGGRVDPDRWLRDRLHDHARDHENGRDLGRDRGGHAHGSIRSTSLIHDGAVPLAAIQDFLDLAMATHGPRLLRLKGIVRAAEHPNEPLVLHAVQTTLHPPARLAAWPTPDRRTRIVVIADGVPERHWRDLFAAFTGGARVDVPDRAALTDNPLAVPGM